MKRIIHLLIEDTYDRVNKYKLIIDSEKRGRKLYRKMVKLIGKEKIKNDLPLSSVDDKILNFNQILGINNKHPEAYYSDILKRYGLKYSDQDVIAARKLQALAVRDAVAKELERRNYE